MRSFAPGSTAALRQQVLARHHRKLAKGAPKLSTIAVYASVFALIIAVVAVGYRAPQKSTGVANATTITTSSQAQQTSVNQVVATNIAANLAETTNLSVAPNVANLAVSAKINSELSQSSDAVITKPQILQPTAENRSIVNYTSKAGDTTDILSAQFGVSKDTVKWANGLVSDAVTEGKVLQILPTNGVLYTVKAGDTAQSIGDKYKVDPTRIVLYNDLDQVGLTADIKIILPGAVLPNNERPGYVAPVATRSYGYVGSSYFASGSVGNRYAPGNCTWYAYEYRAQLGRPVGSFWGNAATWAAAARANGYLVDKTPSAGAVLVDEFGYFGHVAVVESVADNGDIIVSEMNNYAYGGYNQVNKRPISAGQAVLYKYIH